LHNHIIIHGLTNMRLNLEEREEDFFWDWREIKLYVLPSFEWTSPCQGLWMWTTDDRLLGEMNNQFADNDHDDLERAQQSLCWYYSHFFECAWIENKRDIPRRTRIIVFYGWVRCLFRAQQDGDYKVNADRRINKCHEDKYRYKCSSSSRLFT
jgi:hypothetical protein